MRDTFGYVSLALALSGWIIFAIASAKLVFLPYTKTSDLKPGWQLLYILIPFLHSSPQAGRYFVMLFWSGLLAGVFSFSGAYLLRWPFTLNGIEFGGGQ